LRESLIAVLAWNSLDRLAEVLVVRFVPWLLTREIGPEGSPDRAGELQIFSAIASAFRAPEERARKIGGVPIRGRQLSWRIREGRAPRRFAPTDRGFQLIPSVSIQHGTCAFKQVAGRDVGPHDNSERCRTGAQLPVRGPGPGWRSTSRYRRPRPLPRFAPPLRRCRTRSLAAGHCRKISQIDTLLGLGLDRQRVSPKAKHY
jgi:hypothetical protein